MLLVGARGFEPPTSRSQTERTTRLCYAPKGGILIQEGRIYTWSFADVKNCLVFNNARARWLMQFFRVSGSSAKV